MRLGLLLEQTFPEADISMVSSVINPTGTQRRDSFNRTDEFLFFVRLGESSICPEIQEDSTGEGLDWQTFRLRNASLTRSSRPNQFYAIYIRQADGKVMGCGEPLADEVDRRDVDAPSGCKAVFPVRDNGMEMLWAVVPEEFRNRLSKGYIRAGRSTPDKPQSYIVQYLRAGTINSIESGEIQITGYSDTGAVEGSRVGARYSIPSTQWNRPSHNAQTGGTRLTKSLLADRSFPFPKSLYAVEDTLRFFVADKPNAIILDFFAGSGTTAHAVMRLNKQDGGRRQCISVTNNEVAADEQKALAKNGLRPGDPAWEKWGICDYITKPRIAAAITGRTPEGEPIKGDYKFTDEFPMADGFEENAEFFTLTYETPVSVGHNRAFERIAPLLWMRAGSEGRRIDALPKQGWEVANTYALLTQLDGAGGMIAAIEEKGGAVRVAYIVTDDDRRFQSVAQGLPEGVEAVRLYESYLTNFRFSMGR